MSGIGSHSFFHQNQSDILYLLSNENCQKRTFFVGGGKEEKRFSSVLLQDATFDVPNSNDGAGFLNFFLFGIDFGWGEICPRVPVFSPMAMMPLVRDFHRFIYHYFSYLFSFYSVMTLYFFSPILRFPCIFFLRSILLLRAHVLLILVSSLTNDQAV